MFQIVRTLILKFAQIVQHANIKTKYLWQISENWIFQNFWKVITPLCSRKGKVSSFLIENQSKLYIQFLINKIKIDIKFFSLKLFFWLLKICFWLKLYYKYRIWIFEFIRIFFLLSSETFQNNLLCYVIFYALFMHFKVLINIHFEDIATRHPANNYHSRSSEKKLKDIIINTTNKKITQTCA